MMIESQLILDLRQALGEQGVSDSILDRLAYSHDTFPLALKLAESDTSPYLPDLVVFPQDPAQVAAVMRIAAQFQTPLVVYAGGSGIVGGALSGSGKITLEMKALSSILDFDPLSRWVTVGAGMNGQQLEDSLNARGFTLAHYPQSLRSSTVGGWIAHRATGTGSTRYGGIESLVAGMQVVLPNGELLDLRPTPRSATGPDLKQLFLGSEGTLGIITQATLRVRPYPALRRWMAFTFPDFSDGLEAVRQVIQADDRPAVVRLYDALEAEHLLESSGLPVGSSLLFLSCEGEPELVEWEGARILKRVVRAGGIPIRSQPAERWWVDRFNTRGLLRTLRTPAGVADALEVAGSWRILPDLYAAMKADMEAALGMPERPGQVYGHCSHVYPDGGNLYMIFHGQAPTLEEVPVFYNQVLEAAFQACARLGGTLSHHHGIGLGKARFLSLELGAAGVDVLRAVQHALDPQGLMNPGKIGASSDA